MTRQNIDYLRTNGPVPIPELPGYALDVEDRAAGAARFTLTVRSGHTASDINTGSSGRTASDIAYLFNTHSKTHVAKAWLEANPEYFTDFDDQSILSAVSRSAGKSWTEPFREALVELENADFTTDIDECVKPAESIRDGDSE